MTKTTCGRAHHPCRTCHADNPGAADTDEDDEQFFCGCCGEENFDITGCGTNHLCTNSDRICMKTQHTKEQDSPNGANTSASSMAGKKWRLAMEGITHLLKQASTSETAHHRIALCIGNSNYESEGYLLNAINDSSSVAHLLKSKLGFHVTELQDASKAQMEVAFDRLTDDIKDDSVVFFFFAGHGIEIDGKNYMVPITEGEFDLDNLATRSVDAQAMLRSIEAKHPHVIIFVLDACRINPLKAPTRSVGVLTRTAVPKGINIANMSMVSKGSLISFSCMPSRAALDGVDDSKNSPYTKHLLKNLILEMSILDVLTEVHFGVVMDTKNEQHPQMQSSMVTRYVLASPSKRR